MRRSLRVAAAVACFLAFSAPVSAQELQWAGAVTDDNAMLAYGVPESDSVLIDFSCDRGSGTVTVTLDHEPAKAETGITAEITLSALGSAPGGEVVVAATGQRLDLDDTFILQGTVNIDDKLRGLLVDADTLVVMVEDGAEEIPMKDARQHAKNLIEACAKK